MSILPIGVYYDRMIMPEAPSFFLFLFSIYFFLKWCDFFDRKILILSSICFAFSVILKYSLAPFAFVFLFLFPYSRYKINFKDVIVIFFSFLIVLSVFLIYQLTLTQEYQSEPTVFESIKLFDIFSINFLVC